MNRLTRRDVLAGTAAALLQGSVARAGTIAGSLPFQPGSQGKLAPLIGESWEFFTASEAAMVEALADRIIPPDPQTPGGKEAGCAVFIDRQLAGPFGRSEGLYMSGPFEKGLKQQGSQSPLTPAAHYRIALAALDRYSRGLPGGKAWVDLPTERQDEILGKLESNGIALEGVDAAGFFEALVKDVQQGFFADPMYGGNRNMCAWTMIGYPGAHYDYREWVSRHNQRVTLAPVSIMGGPSWTPKRA